MSDKFVPKNNSISRLLAFDSKFKAKQLNEANHRKTAINLLAHHQLTGDLNVRLPVLQVDKDAIPRCQSFHYIPQKKHNASALPQQRKSHASYQTSTHDLKSNIKSYNSSQRIDIVHSK